MFLFFQQIQTGSWAQPISYSMVPRIFSGVKAAGAWSEHSTSSSAEVQNEPSLYCPIRLHGVDRDSIFFTDAHAFIHANLCAKCPSLLSAIKWNLECVNSTVSNCTKIRPAVFKLLHVHSPAQKRSALWHQSTLRSAVRNIFYSNVWKNTNPKSVALVSRPQKHAVIPSHSRQTLG